MIFSIILGALLLILCIYIFLISPSWSAGRAFDFFEKAGILPIADCMATASPKIRLRLSAAHAKPATE